MRLPSAAGSDAKAYSRIACSAIPEPCRGTCFSENWSCVMRKFFGPMGSVSRITVASQALADNMLGDPTVRAVDVYVPAGRDGQGLPLLVDLVGFTSSGLSHTNWTGTQENIPERLD